MPSLSSVARLGYVTRLVDIRAMSPDFRLTRGVRAVLLGVAVVAVVAAGAVLALVDAIAPSVLDILGHPGQIVSAVLRLAAAAYAVHVVLSTTGASARALTSPPDAKILGHAGYSRADVYVARELAPVLIGALATILTLVLLTVLATTRWAVDRAEVGPDLALALCAVMGALTLRLGLTARLSSLQTGPSRSVQTGLLLAAVVAGGVTGGLLLPVYAGDVGLSEISAAAIGWITSGPNGWILWIVTAGSALTGVALLVLSRHAGWSESVDSTRRGALRRGPTLPRSPWARLATLPLVARRDRGRSDASELVIAQGVGLVLGVFGLGLASFGRTGLDLPHELAVGLVFGTPVASAGLLFGVTSLPALRGLLPVLISSPLGAAGVSSAVAVASSWTLVTVSWPSLPLVWAFSDLSFPTVVAVWASGVLLAPSLFHVAECVLPTRATTGSGERLRQGTPASLLVAVLALLTGGATWASLHLEVPLPLMVMASAATTLTAVLLVRPPIGGYR
ncbi:hypothetical protein BJF80_05885 [Serinicoccus sp. CUA-874]|uniref:hypothetical protein n=1 Tax=Serinicoccus sp. CUA-874 TaxID=1517939 RepID=UPI00095937CD|nr:hypothetical protein [Serinicoccus sp. CUA-874]OLT16829.1 hypothetical protein BJF80_05885 [Serinicoccus sp. CUA-874]